jgi:hypothetical protein
MERGILAYIANGVILPRGMRIRIGEWHTSEVGDVWSGWEVKGSEVG